MAKAAAAKSKSKKTAEPTPEVTEELEEVDGEETEATATTKKADEVTFGASDLARHLSETSGKTVSARELRTLIRKMARDGSARVNREITAGNRTRYNWSGIDDPEVQAIITAFNSGELEADKQEKLKQLKENKAAKKAAGEPTGKKGKKGKGKKAEPAAEVEDSDEDLELDD